MSIEGNCFKGRGTTDDKGPAITAFYGAIAAREAGVPVNIRFLWEMEEEIGSPSFQNAMERHRGKLATDLVVVSDTIWVTRGKPSTPAGLRGLLCFVLSLETAEHDLHSGLVGGAARNPLAELMKVVATLMDGEIRAREGARLLQGRGEAHPGGAGRLVARRLRRGGFQAGPCPQVPAHGGPPEGHEAHLGPSHHGCARGRGGLHGGRDQDRRAAPGRGEAELPAGAGHGRPPHLRAHPGLREQALPGRGGPRGPRPGALLGPCDRSPRRGREGCLPLRLRRTLRLHPRGRLHRRREDHGGRTEGCRCYFLGLSLPSHGYHAPNENYDWEQASGGMALFARFFQSCSQLGQRPEGAEKGGTQTAGTSGDSRG